MIKTMTKPVLFNTEMVRAILDGRKTVTRRIIRPQPKMQICYTCMGSHNVGKWGYPSKDAWKYWGDEWMLPDNISDEEKTRLWTPPCHTDDILYVRETWTELFGRTLYRADYGCVSKDVLWKPSIHMPKEKARLFLKVHHVGVERIQDITMDQIDKEGSVPSCRMCHFNEQISEHSMKCSKGIEKAADCNLENMFPETGFRGLWDRTVPKKELELYGWDANPFVWKIEFEKISKRDAQLHL